MRGIPKYLGRKNPPPPKSYYPVDDPLWGSFVHWVSNGGVVRRKLFEGKKEDWKIIWETYVAGASAMARLVTRIE